MTVEFKVERSAGASVRPVEFDLRWDRARGAKRETVLSLFAATSLLRRVGLNPDMKDFPTVF
jgi:hypothetical protein